MTTHRKSNTRPKKSDYEALLEQQNEQLIKKLSAAQRLNEYHVSKRFDCIKCGITFIHNTEIADAPEYYSSNEYWHPVNKLWEHGGLHKFVDMIMSPDDAHNLVIQGGYLAFSRNGNIIWEVFMNYTDPDKWQIEAIQIHDEVYSGKNIKNKKKYKWKQIINWLKTKNDHYKQDY